MLSFYRRLLFEKKPLVIESDYDLDESVRRLSAIVRGWPYLSLRQGLIGRVTPNKVRMARVVPLQNNPCKPVFFGAFHAGSDNVILEGHFTLEPFARIFLSIWLGAIFLIFLLSIPLTIYFGFYPPARLAAITLPARLVNLLVLPFYLLLAVGLAWGIVAFQKWLARNDEAFITERVRGVLQKPSDEIHSPEIPTPWGERTRF